MADIQITAEFNDLKQLAITLDSVKTKAKSTASSAAGDFDSLKRSISPAYNALRTFEGKVDVAKRALDAKIISNREYARTLIQIQQQAGLAGVKVDNLGNVAGMATNKMNKFGSLGMQQVGYQVGDFLVQVQSGTNAFVAFGQQATQLVGVLGMMKPELIGLSAGLGIAIPLVTAIGAALMRTSQEGKNTTDVLGDLTKATNEYASAADSLHVSTSTLSEDFGGFAIKAREVLEAIKEINRIKFEESMAAVVGLSGLSSDALKNAFGKGGRGYLQNFQSQVLSDLMGYGGRDRDQAAATLGSQLYQFSTTKDDKERLEIAEQLLKTFEKYAGPYDDLNEEQREFVDSMREAEQNLLNVIKAGNTSKRELTEVEKLRAKIQEENYDRVVAAEGAIKKAQEEREAAAKRITTELQKHQSLENNLLTTAIQKIRLSDLEVLHGRDSAKYKEQERDFLLQNLRDSLKLQGVDEDIVEELVRMEESHLSNLDLIEDQVTQAKELAKALGEAGRAFTTSQELAYQADVFDPRGESGLTATEALRRGIKIDFSRPDEDSNKPKSTAKSPAQQLDEYMVSLEREAALRRVAVGETEEYVRMLELEEEYKKRGLEVDYERIDNLVKLEAETRKLTEAENYRENQIQSFSDKMETALMSIVDGSATVEDAFKSMLRGILLEIYQQQVAKPVASFFGNMLFGGANANGNAFSGGNVIPFANGGVVGSPTFFPMANGMGLMGEAGPEAIMPLKRGSDGKLGVAGGGQTVINQTINVSTGVQQTVRNEIKTLMPQIAEQSKNAVLDAKRRGGSYGKRFA